MRRVAWVGGSIVAAAVGAWAFTGASTPGRAGEPRPAVSLDEGDAMLARAADCLGRGDQKGAVPHLRDYVRAFPDAHQSRLHLAELLYRQGQAAEARTQFERFLWMLPAGTALESQRVQCHTRLMDLASDANDGFAEELHRGVGLYLLVQRWDADPARRDEAASEQTLAKSLAALRSARDDRPSDARANAYLAEVYARLGQAQAAEAAWRAAWRGLPDPRLSDAELARVREARLATAGRLP